MKYGRKILRDVQPYIPGEQPQTSGVIKLNTNENPYPPSPRVLEAVRALGPEAIRKYPDPPARALREACADRFGFPDASWVVAGNGMDELLALTVRTFTDPGDSILSTSPTYTLYETLAHLHGAQVRSIPLDETFQLPGAFYEAQARVCFLPRPNAPTGICAPKTDLEQWCATFDGLIVIDEAYVDFAEDTCMDFPKRYPNVVVMRTFSKSFSMAGMRLGVAFAQPEIIREYLKTKDPMNVDAFTQAAGLAAIQDYDYMVSNAAKIKATRSRLIAELERMGFVVPPSQANFVLAEWRGEPDARTLFESLKERKIYIRYFDKPRLTNSIRITVGTDEEIDAFLHALGELIAVAPQRGG